MVGPLQPIDNYIYLYHTKTLILIPVFPEQVADATSISYKATDILGRSAPIQSYAHSGPRSINITLKLHRDLMQGGLTETNLQLAPGEDYIDALIREMQAIVLPRYGAEEKMVDPPMIAVRFGDDIFCKGVVTQNVTVTYSGPILRTNKYALVDISFNITEVDPYDAESVMLCGSYRLDSSLERNIWKTGTSSNRIESAASLRSV